MQSKTYGITDSETSFLCFIAVFRRKIFGAAMKARKHEKICTFIFFIFFFLQKKNRFYSYARSSDKRDSLTCSMIRTVR